MAPSVTGWCEGMRKRAMTSVWHVAHIAETLSIRLPRPSRPVGVRGT